MRPGDLAAWQARRERARALSRFREAPPAELPCQINPLLFSAAAEERPLKEATEKAKSLCETCEHRLACLIEILRMEGRLRTGLRPGVVAGLTGRERAKIAQQGRAKA